ncbi:hypothetical protein SAMN05443639_102540 [Stigmatella erecta]|uniref:SH3 domain-containing protein n=2 Tax=Stigmatella erecta TaxID=83460 RepID=A0A1I0DHU5_9BACT|nr:hypothetical protein SAMN05443639_102540 [Stigmatella erecta]
MASVMSWCLIFGLAAPKALAEEAPPPRFVMADVARVRKEPKERGAVVGLLRINARVEPLAAENDGKWLPISVPQSRLKGWIAAASLRESEVTQAEAREQLLKALSAGDKPGALSWADRLRALSPAQEDDLKLALKAYERFDRKERASAVRQVLSGEQTLYIAACLPDRTRSVLAQFQSSRGLQPVEDPAALIQWIAGSPWYVSSTGEQQAAQPVDGGRFASPRQKPEPKSNPDDEEEVHGGYGELDRAVLEPCGQNSQEGLLAATWPFQRIGASERTRTPTPPDADSIPSSEHPRIETERETLELTLGGMLHRFELELISKDVGACGSSQSARITHHLKDGKPKTLTLILQEIVTC